MKTFLVKALIVCAVICCASHTSIAQVYVTVRPPAPVLVRPVAPSRSHVWIAEEWNGRGGRYEYAGGHWVVPPHYGWVWIPGHWRRSHFGWRWFPGHWRRGRRY